MLTQKDKNDIVAEAIDVRSEAIYEAIKDIVMDHPKVPGDIDIDDLIDIVGELEEVLEKKMNHYVRR